MGKKKSVVLMVLLTIVIVVLCAITLFPSIYVSQVNKWVPVVNQYDLSTELGGGYYAYYYPEGVISETEFINNGESTDDYKQHGGLYLSTDEKDGVLDANGEVREDFKTAFNGAVAEVRSRYEAMGYSDYRVAVVDDYCVRVELPASDVNAGTVLSRFALTGDISFEMSGEVVEELKEEGVTASDLIYSVSVGTRYKTAFVKIRFTDKGKAMIERVKGDLSEASSTTDVSSATTLEVKVGDTTVAYILKDLITDDSYEARVNAAAQENIKQVEIVSVLLNSALKGGYEVSFDDTRIDVRTFKPVYGEEVMTLLYIALGVALLATLVLPIVKMGRFGVVATYSSLSYLIVVGICYKYITGAVFEFTLGSALIFLVGLILINALHYHTYNAIKNEFTLGKTVESSVKGGYKKTLWNTVDIYVVLLLGALALLIGAGGLNTLALQALICVITGAFINLLWTRGINFTFLSASKNKFKYFRFVREDDEDDE